MDRAPFSPLRGTSFPALGEGRAPTAENGPGMELRAAVILATRDRASSLERTLETLRRQELPGDWAVEAVVVDDGSQDRTAGVLDAFEARPGPFRVVRLRTGGVGKSAALNAAMARTEAPVLAFTDDDMDHDPGWLRALVAHLETCDCVGVHGRIEVTFPAGRPSWMTPRAEVLLGASHEAPRPDGSVRHLSGGNMAVRREAARAAGPFREDMGPRGRRAGYSEDVEWSLRVGRRGRLCYGPEALNFHCIPPGRARQDYLFRRQYDYVRTEWSLRMQRGELARGRELVSEFRGLLGALLRRRRRFQGFDYGLELAARLGRLAALLGRP